ncbi:MAG: FG-GAP-like repeat-containing protein [bacterium]
MKHFVQFFLIIALAVTVNAQNAIDEFFKEHIIQQEFQGACSITGFDMDRDGDFDFVASASDGGLLSWFENDSNQNFTEHSISNNLAGARVFDVGDVDNDGDFDIVTTAYAADKFSLFENEGNQSFTEHIINTNWDGPSYIELEDVDLDGDIDILAAACNGNILGWFENDGNQIFTIHILKQNWEKANFITSVDIDIDGDNDLMCSSKTGEIIIFENDGNSNFTERIICNNWGGPNAMRAADFDNDGDLDIAATSCAGMNQVAWFRNDGNLTFVKNLLREGYQGARDARVFDFDNDGDMDILTIAWISSVASIFVNDGNGNFTEHIFCDTAYDMLRFSIIDLDGDNDLDILGACYGQNELRWWENKLNYLEAGFTSDNTTGHAPLTIDFADNSVATSDITSWKWDFNNDGTIDSELQNPNFTFDQPGEYTVSLEVTSAWGTKRSIKENYISIFSNGESSLRLNGNSGQARCIANSSNSLANAFTLEAWIFIDDFSKSRRIFDKDKIKITAIPNTLFNDYCVYVELYTGGGTLSKIFSPNNSIEPSKWVHVAITYSNDGQIHIYINSIEQELRFVGTQPSGDLQDNSNTDLYIGNDQANSSPFYGRIDEIRIWNTARSQSEITDSYLQYLNGNENGLIACWKINEGNGSSTNDITANGNNLLLENITWGQGIIFNLVNVEDNPDDHPTGYLLLRNYPNPFNPSTKIIYELADESFVTLKVYDLLGKEVVSLVKENQKAGRHEINFDAGDGLANGVYIYTLSTKDNIISNKMLLLK